MMHVSTVGGEQCRLTEALKPRAGIGQSHVIPARAHEGVMTNPELIAKYREARARGDEREARRWLSNLVTQNAGLARRLVRRWARPATEEDAEDAFQAACMGILRAVELFDLGRGTTFSTYAGHQIRAHIQQWAGKTCVLARPRSSSMPAALAERARIIRNTRGREPTAEELGVTQEQLDEWSEGTLFVELDAHANDEDDRGRSFQLSSDTEEAQHVVDKMLLETAWADAISELSERNAAIADAVFWQGRTLRDVGEAFGLSHVQVSQICERVEARLKRAVKRATNAPPSSRPRAA